MLIYYKTWIYQCLIKQVKSPSICSLTPNSVWICQSGRIGNRGVTPSPFNFFLPIFLSKNLYLGEVKLSTIFSLKEKNLPLGELKLSLVNIILYLREMGLPFGNIGLSGETCLSYAFFLREMTFPAYFSFRGVNFPLGEKALFLEEHSLNLPALFSLVEMNLPHGGVGFSIPFSLGRMNSSFGEFVLSFGESFLFWKIWLRCYAPCCIPIEFLLKGISVQTATHSFFNLSPQTKQYLGTHTFPRESFPAFLDLSMLLYQS